MRKYVEPMTLDEKLLQAFEAAEKRTKAHRAGQKLVVLQAVQVIKDNKILFHQRLDANGLPQIILVGEKAVQAHLRKGYKIAEKPKGVPAGVSPAKGEEEEKPAPKGRGRKTSTSK